jgi:ADP-ribose pyrophosphatase YjhB (NUDIX family)
MINFRLTIDCVVFAYDNKGNQLKILLIKRNNEPAKNQWALPGGFVTTTEEFIETAKKKLKEETGAGNIYLEQLNAYSLTDPSPENRIVSIAYYSIMKLDEFSPTDINNHIYKWAHVKDIPQLPFDHGQKVKDAISRVKERISSMPIVFNLLPSDFSINQLQKIYEEIYDVKLDNRNFRKKAKKLTYLEPLNKLEQNVSHRPGLLYRFNKAAYDASAASNII